MQLAIAHQRQGAWTLPLLKGGRVSVRRFPGLVRLMSAMDDSQMSACCPPVVRPFVRRRTDEVVRPLRLEGRAGRFLDPRFCPSTTAVQLRWTRRPAHPRRRLDGNATKYPAINPATLIDRLNMRSIIKLTKASAELHVGNAVTNRSVQIRTRTLMVSLARSAFTAVRLGHEREAYRGTGFAVTFP